MKKMLKDNVIVHLNDEKEDIETINQHIDTMLRDYDCEEFFHGLYDVSAKNTKEDVNKEKEKLANLIERLYNDIDYLQSCVDKITVKKNGRFRKNGIYEVGCVESITFYFTDFTNAWNTLSIRLVATDETNVALEITEKTYTH